MYIKLAKKQLCEKVPKPNNLYEKYLEAFINGKIVNIEKFVLKEVLKFTTDKSLRWGTL
jgi:hypothetical protein